MNMFCKCRLFIYDREGQRKTATINCDSIYNAVKEGYQENYNFLVVEADDVIKPILYWQGSFKDKERKDFNKWPSLAEEKDIQFANK